MSETTESVCRKILAGQYSMFNPTPKLTAKEEAAVQIEAHEKASSIVAASGGDFVSTYDRIARELRARFKAPTPTLTAEDHSPKLIELAYEWEVKYGLGTEVLPLIRQQLEETRHKAFEEAAEMLKPIGILIENVENRCMAADGPVTPTECEIERDEVKQLLKLAWEAVLKSRTRQGEA